MKSAAPKLLHQASRRHQHQQLIRDLLLSRRCGLDDLPTVLHEYTPQAGDLRSSIVDNPSLILDQSYK